MSNPKDWFRRRPTEPELSAQDEGADPFAGQALLDIARHDHGTTPAAPPTILAVARALRRDGGARDAAGRDSAGRDNYGHDGPRRDGPAHDGRRPVPPPPPRP